jgi:A/G-specific adenine glycosylase
MRARSGPLVHPEPTLPAPATALAHALVGWFGAHARVLPWRQVRTPYRVWLSEVMLQQTRVATVVPYFERFCARFPDVTALAAASEDEVLSLWSGLGYYSRGRNLHRAARLVAEERGGTFPNNGAALRELPGVGAYTAAAIASLAFGRAEAVVDGNVQRVLSRLCDDATPVGSSAGLARTRARAEALVVASEAPGALNEALMELGALVCTPHSPACEACPWASACLAKAHGTVGERPVKTPRKARASLRVACALIYDGSWVWLEKRPAEGLFGGLYEPPGTLLPGRASAARAVRALVEERGLQAPVCLPPPLRVRRTLTHRELLLEVVPVAVTRAFAASPWFSADGLAGVGISSAVRAALLAGWPGAADFLGATRRPR